MRHPLFLGGPLAQSRLDELKKRFEENPRRFFAPLANEYRKAGDLEQAIALCQQHLEGQAGNMNGHVVYGQALFDAGRFGEAEATFATAVTLDPENLIALRHLGDIARTNNDSQKALEWYQRVLDADPRNDEILGFIDELKGAIAVESVAPAGSSDGMAAAGEAAELVAPPTAVPQRPSHGDPTPIAPIRPVPPPEPAPRMSLLDMSLDLSGATEAATFTPHDVPVVAPPPVAQLEAVALPEPAAQPAGESVGEIELSDLSFDQPSDVVSASAAPSDLPEAAQFEPMPVAGTESGDALGWEMASVDLDASAAEPAAAPDESALPAEPPQVFVTETMAELYLQQGFREQALQVYRQLAQMNPDDASLRDRVARLENSDSASRGFEALSHDTPGVAPGTDSTVMMPDEPSVAATDSAFTPMPSIDSFVEPAAASTDDHTLDGVALDMSAVPAVESDASVQPGALESETWAAPAQSEVGAPAPSLPDLPTPEFAMDDLQTSEAPPAAPAYAEVASNGVIGEPSPYVATARSYFAALAARRAVRHDGTPPRPMATVPAPATEVVAPSAGGTIDHLFGSGTIASTDDGIAYALATAVGGVDTSAIRGHPTQPAESELSLDFVFRGEPTPRSTAAVPRQSQMLKFDQFFAADAPGSPSTPSSDTAAPASPADDAHFNSWLQGLKNS